MNAKPMPVFPLVGSTNIVFPGVIFPSSSAAWIMLQPIRSFTLQHGSIISSFGDGASGTDAGDEDVNLTGGVFPDLRTGRLEVHLRVGRVLKLLQNEGIIRRGGDFLSLLHRTLHPLC